MFTTSRGRRQQLLITGIRNADSPTRDRNGELLFVKPWEEQESFEKFVDFVVRQEKSGAQHVEEVRYAQTREFPPHT